MSTQTPSEDKHTDTSTTDETTPTLTEDDVFYLLSSSRRRAVLDELHANEPLSKLELAQQIASREHDGTGTVDQQERSRVNISLHQQHLPKLTDAGVVQGDEDAYRLGPNAGRLLEKMEYSTALGGLRERVGSAFTMNVFVNED